MATVLAIIWTNWRFHLWGSRAPPGAEHENLNHTTTTHTVVHQEATPQVPIAARGMPMIVR